MNNIIFTPLLVIFLMISSVGLSQLDSNDVTVSYGQTVPFQMDPTVTMKEVIVQVEIEDVSLISEVAVELQAQSDLNHKLAIVRITPVEFNDNNFINNILILNIGIVDDSQSYLINSYTTSFQGAQSGIVTKTL